MTWIRAHWRGELPLAWSFWVNLVLLRAAIFWLEGFVRPPLIGDRTLLTALALAFFVLFHIVVYAWQIVGVLRAVDRFVKDSGGSIWAPAAQVGLLASLILTAASVFATVQTVLHEEPEISLAESWDRAREARYSFDISADGRLLYVTGDIELGLTRNLTPLLRENPAIEGIVLSSDGGYVVEGRGIARLMREHGLDSYVYGTCKSACTTAFIGGRYRVLGPDGRLGFHQYWAEPEYFSAFMDPAGEQEKDRRLFASQGVEAAFLERIFDKPHEDIWFPSHAQLLAAGVVHRIDRAGPANGGG